MPPVPFPSTTPIRRPPVWEFLLHSSSPLLLDRSECRPSPFKLRLWRRYLLWAAWVCQEEEISW